MNESTLGQFPLSQESCSEGKGDRIRAVSLVHEPQPLPPMAETGDSTGGHQLVVLGCGPACGFSFRLPACHGPQGRKHALYSKRS